MRDAVQALTHTWPDLHGPDLNFEAPFLTHAYSTETPRDSRAGAPECNDVQLADQTKGTTKQRRQPYASQCRNLAILNKTGRI